MELKLFYIPCKAKIYLDVITTKRSITILRQIVRLFNYNIKSSEKYVSKKKQVAYQLVPMNNNKHLKIINKKNMIITFD